jgi:hypothetical protein
MRRLGPNTELSDRCGKKVSFDDHKSKSTRDILVVTELLSAGKSRAVGCTESARPYPMPV